ncbi:MAG: NADPH-dependent FMN reductase [Alkalispirochaeta sp.]
MATPKIGVIIGTTRAARVADKPVAWFMEQAVQRSDMEFEVVDLRDYPMPFFDEAASNAFVPSTNEVARAWQKKIAGFDGYIFVTGEYNNSVPAVLKNALDYAYPEWGRKAAAFFGYGSAGGTRAVQHLREIAIELQMAPVRHAVFIMGGDFMALMQGQKEVREFTYLEPLAAEMLDQLAWWATALKNAREG